VRPPAFARVASYDWQAIWIIIANGGSHAEAFGEGGPLQHSAFALRAKHGTTSQNLMTKHEMACGYVQKPVREVRTTF
jgi:hypothetical protein